MSINAKQLVLATTLGISAFALGKLQPAQSATGEATSQEKKETDPTAEEHAGTHKTAAHHGQSRTGSGGHSKTVTVSAHHQTATLKTGELVSRDRAQTHTRSTSFAGSTSSYAQGAKHRSEGAKTNAGSQPGKPGNDVHLKKNNARMF